MPLLAPPQTYICYYGPGQLQQIQQADWAILQAGHYTPTDLAQLNAHQTVTFAYLSIGEEPLSVDKSWHIRTPDLARQLITNHLWQTNYVDCRSPEWQSYLLSQAIPRLQAQGFQGILLDTLDVQEQFPETRPGVIQLLQRLRHTFPNLYLIANRGFSLLDDVAPLLDAILFESYSTYHYGKLCAAWPEKDHAWLALQAARLHTTGLPILALDYANPDQPELAHYAQSRARAAGFIPYVTNWALDSLFFNEQ